jgi:hypothetical protein
LQKYTELLKLVYCNKLNFAMKKFFGIIALSFFCVVTKAYYTTNGKNIVDRKTGETVILKGIGLGGWLLPEGYMWGIRQLDRPWQFEKAIVDLVGKEKADEFWKIYHDNYVTEQDFAAMKLWGINTVRIPLLASVLQPREGQPDKAPYNYSEEGFRFLDSIVKWSEKYHIGVIWDMHGAPGAQSKENIADSDGEAHLWKEKDKYFPLCIDLWYQIALRYKGKECIVGYDLLNEPLLSRYPEIDKTLLRDLYVLLTEKIRTVDSEGIMFVEGDEWAQEFEILEPLDWDKHLALAFHSYPPTTNADGLKRWEVFRDKCNIPLWHGETGEQRPPYEVNKEATTFLAQENVGWAWWTHKKFDNTSQPWSIIPTEGFTKVLNYWKGQGARPSAADAEKWLFDQALKTNTKYCVFLPQMVNSLIPLNAISYLNSLTDFQPELLKQPSDISTFIGIPVNLQVLAVGNNIKYQWYKNDEKIEGAISEEYRFITAQNNVSDECQVKVENSAGSISSEKVKVKIIPYTGPELKSTKVAPVIDGKIDDIWKKFPNLAIDKAIFGTGGNAADFGGYFKIAYDNENLYFLLSITDDTLVNNLKARYQNDCIEIYLDIDNDRPKTYTKNEFSLRIVRDKPNVNIERGNRESKFIMKQENTNKGYIVELALPWTDIGQMYGDYFGLEVQIIDNDGTERDKKYSWYSERDEVWSSPASIGVMKVAK